jgi:hypothetical protein
MTPAAVHFGQAAQLWTDRQRVLQLAYVTYPERFVKGPPQPPALPTEVWINLPKAEAACSEAAPTQPRVDTEVRH